MLLSTKLFSTIVLLLMFSSKIYGQKDTAQQGSFRFPDSCTSSADCNFLVTYQISGEDKVVFEISGKNNWAGVGFSDDNLMPDTDMLICVSDQVLSGHYYAHGRSTPVKIAINTSVVEVTENSFEGGVVKCKISRLINPKIGTFRDLNANWFLLGAIGGLNDNSLRIHSQRRASDYIVKVTEAVNAGPYMVGGQRGQLPQPGKLKFFLTLCLSLLSYFL